MVHALRTSDRLCRLLIIAKKLGEAREWTRAGQHGDPNGARAYQADKYLGDAIDDLLELIENGG
jgi:hypothetical protein